MNHPQLRHIENQNTPSKNIEKGNRKNSVIKYQNSQFNKISSPKINQEKIKELLIRLIKYSKEEYKKKSKRSSNILSHFNHNKSLFKEYATSHFTFSEELEIQQISETKKKGKISVQLRMKIVDSMYHVYGKYQSSPKSIFKCVSIFDNYIASKSKEFKEENELKLIGMACIFIASKYEDKIPLSLKHLEMLTDYVYKKAEFHDMEKNVLNALNFDIFEPDVDDFIRHILMKLINTNKNQLKDLDVYNHIPILEKLSLLIANMLLLEPKFIDNKMHLKAVVCIVFAFDVMRTQRLFGEEDNEGEKFLGQIIKNYIHNQNVNKMEAEGLYNDINQFYQSKNFIESSYIGEAIQRFTEEITNQ